MFGKFLFNFHSTISNALVILGCIIVVILESIFNPVLELHTVSFFFFFGSTTDVGQGLPVLTCGFSFQWFIDSNLDAEALLACKL